MDDLTPLISAIASDRESGASELLQRAIDVLRRAMPRTPDDRLQIARALCRAQPGMAPIWNAALAALMNEEHPARFERFVRRVERAPGALTRVMREVLSEPGAAAPAVYTRPLSLVTVSYSASVRQGFEALATTRPLRVACAEGRPAFEGRRMAAALAEAGAAVRMFSDAAIAGALAGADAVVVGADAVAAEWVMNKVGTRMLAAASSMTAVPFYVVASRDKFCAPALARVVMPRDGPAREIWDAAPVGVEVRNPDFEQIPLDLVTAVITDGGLMPSADVAGFCVSLDFPALADLVKQLAS